MPIFALPILSLIGAFAVTGLGPRVPNNKIPQQQLPPQGATRRSSTSAGDPADAAENGVKTRIEISCRAMFPSAQIVPGGGKARL